MGVTRMGKKVKTATKYNSYIAASRLALGPRNATLRLYQVKLESQTI